MSFLMKNYRIMDSPAMKNSEILRYLGDDTDNIYNEMWKEVKAQ